MYDVIVIGGSYAGLAASLQLARARRSVLIVDGGQRRNRFARTAHGFLGQDGVPPEVIAERGRADVLAYKTVEWRQGLVSEARGVQDDFRVVVDGVEARARRLVIATGVVDELPQIPGLRERWGVTVFHCPYCHGYELERGRIGILGVKEESMKQAVLAAEWAGPGQATFFLNQAFEPTSEDLAELRAREIRVERARVRGVTGERDITLMLDGGTQVTVDGLFVVSTTAVAGPFAAQLGCELDASPVGTFYKTDALKETTVPGVFACGDAGLAMSTVAIAVGDGTRAGTSAHQSLVFRRAPT